MPRLDKWGRFTKGAENVHLALSIKGSCSWYSPSCTQNKQQQTELA